MVGRWLMAAVVLAGAAASARGGQAGRITVTETRLKTGDGEIRVTDGAGKTAATYRIILSKHHRPATSANDPVIRQWRKWKFGAFLCFNSNQFTGTELCRAKDPAVYAPPVLDVKQWIATFKQAGMTHAVLTVRHTSGFLLWDSPTSVHDVAAGGNKTDAVKAFVAECRRAGLAPGFYYCLWGGKWNPNANARALILAQLHELATRHGAIPYFWIDMMNWAPKNLTAQEIYDSLKNVNPKTVVIFNQHIQDGRQIKYWPTDVLNGEMVPPPAGGHNPKRTVGGATYYVPFEYEPCSQQRPPKGTPGASGRYCWFTYGPGKSFAPSRPYAPEFLYRQIMRGYRNGASNVLLAAAPDHTGRIRSQDVAQLVKLGRMLKDPSLAPPPSLTTGCKITASGTWQNNVRQYGPALAVDDNPATRWGGAEGTTAGWLAVDLGRTRTVNRIWISEGWDRARKFELQVRTDGTWRTVYRGTKIGRDFRATVGPFTARHVRLNIVTAIDVPTIWEFQLFGPKPKVKG